MRITAHRSAGFTVFELMLVIIVAAIILGIGAPNLRQFIWNSRMTGAANDMLMAVHTARTEAIKRRLRTVVCISADPEAAEPECDGDGSQGWAVFVDENNDGAASVGEPVILRHGPVPESISVALFPDDNDSYVAFQGTGFSQPITGTIPIASARLCDSRGNQKVAGDDYSSARGLIISPTGRPRVTRSVSEIGSTFDGCP